MAAHMRCSKGRWSMRLDCLRWSWALNLVGPCKERKDASRPVAEEEDTRGGYTGDVSRPQCTTCDVDVDHIRTTGEERRRSADDDSHPLVRPSPVHFRSPLTERETQKTVE